MTLWQSVFVKGLRDAPTMASKIYEKDSQTLVEVIRHVEKLSAAHQLTATLTPSAVSMMSSDNKCFVCGQTGHFGCHCPDVQCYGFNGFGLFAQDCPPQDSSIRNCMSPWQISFKHWYTHNWRDRSHLYCDPRHRRHYGRSQSHSHSYHNRSSSFRRHTSCSSDTTASHIALQLMDALITSHAVIPTGITAPHPTLIISPAGTTPQTRAGVAAATPTMPHKDLSQGSQAMPKTINPP